MSAPIHKIISADHLFDGEKLLHNTALVMSADGEIIDLATASEVDPVLIDRRRGWIIPGMVNAHCHLELSNMKGVLPEKTGMADFLLGVVSMRHAEADQASGLAEDAAAEMYARGISAVGDISNTTLSIPAKQKSKLRWHNYIEATGFLPAVAQQRFDSALAVYQEFADRLPGHSRSIVPHAPYTVSEELYAKIAMRNEPLQCIHHAESRAEIDFMRNKTGGLVGLYEKLGIPIDFFEPASIAGLGQVQHQLKPAGKMLWVHNCHITEEDIAHLDSAVDHYFCLCANANLYIGNPLPDIALMRQNGLQICLGTDSLASNHQLCLIHEMRTLQAAFPHIALTEMLTWATVGGAKALMLDGELGRLTRGKKPGLAWLKNVGEHGDLAKASAERLY